MSIFLIIYALGMLGTVFHVMKVRPERSVSPEHLMAIVADVLIVLLWPSMMVFAIFTYLREAK